MKCQWSRCFRDARWALHDRETGKYLRRTCAPHIAPAAFHEGGVVILKRIVDPPPLVALPAGATSKRLRRTLRRRNMRAAP